MSKNVKKKSSVNDVLGLENTETIKISDKGFDNLMDLMENPPEPTEALERIIE